MYQIGPTAVEKSALVPWEHLQFRRPWSLWGPETFEDLTTKREALGCPPWKLESND